GSTTQSPSISSRRCSPAARAASASTGWGSRSGWACSSISSTPWPCHGRGRVGRSSRCREVVRGEHMDIATAQFERALVLFRSGNDRLANQAAKAVLDCAPDHVGGMMLLLATAGGCGDDDTINEALLTISEHYPRLLAIPEVLDLLQSDLMAPVVRSQAFRTVFAPSLRVARGQLCDDADRQMARLVVQEAVRDATVDAALAGAPAFPEPRPDAGGALHLVDPSTGVSVGSLEGHGEYLLGRAGQIVVDH